MGGRSPFLRGAGSHTYFEFELNQQAVSEEYGFQVQRNYSYATMCKSGGFYVLCGYKYSFFF